MMSQNASCLLKIKWKLWSGTLIKLFHTKGLGTATAPEEGWKKILKAGGGGGGNNLSKGRYVLHDPIHNLCKFP